MCRAQSSHLKPFSCSDTPQDDSGLTTPQNETLTKLCDDVAARIEARMKQQRQCLNEQRYDFTSSFVHFWIVVLHRWSISQNAHFTSLCGEDVLVSLQERVRLAHPTQTHWYHWYHCWNNLFCKNNCVSLKANSLYLCAHT